MGRGPHVPDADLLAAVRDCEHPVVGTAEIRERCDLSSQTQLLRRLRGLRDDGRLGGRQIGRQWVWWLPGDVR